MEKQIGPPVIACSLSTDDLTTRSERWDRLNQRAAIDTVTIENGLRLVFRRGNGVAEELNALAALERECCTFADWSVRVEDAHVVLDVTAAGDAIAVVQEMFGKPRTEHAR